MSKKESNMIGPTKRISAEALVIANDRAAEIWNGFSSEFRGEISRLELQERLAKRGFDLSQEDTWTLLILLDMVDRHFDRAAGEGRTPAVDAPMGDMMYS